jgi:hypothetical protein
MKIFSILAIAASAKAFSILPQQNSAVSLSSTQVSMGLFDFFSDEAKEKRELKKRQEVEEQERMQKVIMDRRRNPEKMEEYEANVQYRRELRMMGDDEAADKVDLYKDADEQSLLDGTSGLNK